MGQWVVTSEFGTAAGGRARRTTNRLTTGPLAALSLMTALALYGPSAMAAVDITNIGFEDGTLSGWTYSKTGTQGSTSYSGNGVGASVVTGMTDFAANNGSHSWTVTPFGNNMASLQAGSGSDTFATAAAALGLNAASSSLVQTTMDGEPKNASWLYQDLTLAAGDYFSMAWQYVSTDYEPFNDASLTSLINLGDASVLATVNNQNAQYALLGATNLGTGSYSTGSYGATGWQVATYQVSTAGTYRLGFMSLNLKDTAWSPVLFVDQAPGLTFDKGVPFGPVAPNPGSGAPTTPTTPTGPIVIDGPKGTDDLGNEDEASFEGGTLVVDKDTNVDVDFKIDDKPGTIDQNGHDSTFTGKIEDSTAGVPGSLIVKNSGNGGSVTLTNTNGYTGTTEVDENTTLALAGNGSIDKSKKLVIDGTLDVTQATPVVNITSLDGKGDVALGNNTLSITDANDAFEGTIGGQGDVAIKGGTQVLSGTNTYAGGTSVSNNAVLQVSSDENLGDAAGKLTLDGGTLHTTGDVNSDRDVVLAGNGTFTIDTNTTLTNSGEVSGNGGLIKNGEGGLDLSGTVSHSGGTTVNEGELTLSGQNTYTGGTTLNGGVLNVSSDGNLGDAAGGLTFNGGELHTTGDVNSDRDVVLAGNGTFTTDTNTTLTNSGEVSGNGGLIKNGEGGLDLTGTVSHSGGTTVNEGELTLSGQNTYTGGTTLNGGVLNVSSDGNLGDAAGGLTFNGGELHTTGDVNSDRDVVLAGNGTFTTDTNTTLTNSGEVSGNGGLIKNGEGGLDLTGTVSHSGGTTVNEGELTLSGQNTYTGGTTLNGGVLNVSSDGNLGDAAGGLTFNGGTLHTTGDVNSNRDVVLAGDGTFTTDTNTTLTNSGDVSGTGGLIKNGEGGLDLTGTVSHSGGTTVNEGELTLSGQNTYTGGTTLNGGVLNVSSDGNLGDVAGGLTFNGGELHTTGDVNSNRDVVLAGNGTFTTDTNTTLTNSGDVSGTGGLIKNGEGGLDLTGTVSHSGGTTVNEGELTLSGQNTYTGGTTLNGGVLNVSSDGNLGDAAGSLTFNGGELHTTGDVNSDRDVVLAGNGTFSTDTNTTLTNSGDVSGNGGLIKNGEGGLDLTGTVSHSGGTTVNEGELTLSGQNTYTGGTMLNGGVLNVSSDGNLGDAAGGLTFNGGELHTTGDVNSDRDVVLAGNGTFTTDTNTTLTNSGDVSGTGGLIKNGEGGLDLTGTVSHSGGTTVNEGELTLSGQNTYTGGTTLNGGVLNVSSDGNLGDAAGGLTFNGGTLQATSSMTTGRSMVLDSVGALRSAEGSTLAVTGPISGGGTLVADGQGTLVLGAANTHAGGTLISGGTVVLANAGGLGSGAVAIDDATLRTTVDTQLPQSLLVMGEATLDVASGTTTQLTGMLDGSRSTGCFIKSGAGRLNMAGTAILANGTCVNEGTLSANGVLLSDVQVERAGTVRGTGAIAGNMRVDGTLAPGNSPGTLAVTGTVTLTDAATLQIDIDGYGTGAGAGNYSRLVVSGAAGRFVANGTLQPLLRGISGNASNTFTPKVGDMFRIVSGEGGVTGTFDRLLQPTEGLAASTRFQVYYTTGFDIDLYVTPTAYSADLVGKVNGNGLATAAALDALVEASDAGTTTAEQTDLLRAVWQQDAAELPVLVTALTGENHAKLAALAQSNATALADDVTGRLGQGVLVDASSTRIEQLLWANIGYGDLSIDADASADRFDARQRRATAGIDVYRSSNVAWGAGLGRTTSELERSPLDNTIDSNAFFAYGAARAGAVVLDGMLSYSADRWESQRPDALGAGALSGKASGTTRMASAGVSLPFTAAGLSWQPSLRGNWQKVERNAYREGGDSLAALDIARLNAEGSRATLGLSVGSLVNDPLAARATWQFGVQAGINHGQVRQATVTTVLAGEQVDLSAADAGKGFGRAQLQGTVRLGASSYLYGGVSTEQGSGVENNSVNAGIRIAL